MAGHSKWAQIKRQKAVADAARSRVFSRLARFITIESKKAGGDVSVPGLKNAIERAKAANMPKENIERAVSKGIAKDSGALEEVVYECYGPGGTALLIRTLTDSRNRTNAELKHLLSKQSLGLATPGSALWAFTKNTDGSFIAREPLVDISRNDETLLGELLSLLDEQDDVQEICTNARGYESTRD